MSVAELHKSIGKPSYEEDQGNDSARLRYMGDPDKKGALTGFVVLIEDGKVARVLPTIRKYPISSEGGRIIGYYPADDLSPVELIEKIQLHGDLTKISEHDLSMIASVVLAGFSKDKIEPKSDVTISSESRLIKALRIQHREKLPVHAGDRVKLSDVIQALRISEEKGMR